MVISLTTSSPAPHQREQVAAFLDEVLPRLEREPGVVAVYHFSDPETGESTTLVVWRDDASRLPPILPARREPLTLGRAPLAGLGALPGFSGWRRAACPDRRGRPLRRPGRGPCRSSSGFWRPATRTSRGSAVAARRPRAARHHPACLRHRVCPRRPWSARCPAHVRQLSSAPAGRRRRPAPGRWRPGWRAPRAP